MDPVGRHACIAGVCAGAVYDPGRQTSRPYPQLAARPVPPASPTSNRRRCPPPVWMLPSAGMSNIDELLKYEEDVIAVTRRVFDAFSPELMGALDTAMGMYTTFGRVLGQDSDSTTDIREVNECGNALGAKDNTDLDRIRVAPNRDPVRALLLGRLRAAEDRVEAKLDRGVILLQMQRAFARGVLDVLRQRLTSAIGYQRPVAEGLALLFPHA